jgi:hypothetical protein
MHLKDFSYFLRKFIISFTSFHVITKEKKTHIFHKAEGKSFRFLCLPILFFWQKGRIGGGNRLTRFLCNIFWQDEVDFGSFYCQCFNEYSYYVFDNNWKKQKQKKSF